MAAVGIVILVMSGWRIYNKDPFLPIPFTFPDWAVLSPPSPANELVHNENGLAGALLWHFSSMWLLFIGLAIYLAYGIVSGHFRRRYFPIRRSAVLHDIREFFRGHLAHDLGARNAIQRLLYLTAIVLMVVMVLSGLAIWKPTQLSELAALMGGYEGARIVHFFGMAGIVLFFVVHVALALLVPKVLLPMVTGRVRRSKVPPEVLGEFR